MFYFAVLIFKSYDERSMQTAVSVAPERKEERRSKGQYLSGLSCIIVLKIKIVHEVNNLYFNSSPHLCYILSGSMTHLLEFMHCQLVV